MKNLNKAIPALFPAVFLAAPASAAVDYSGLTSAFDPADIITGLLAIGAVLASVYVAVRGIRMVIGMMRSG